MAPASLLSGDILPNPDAPEAGAYVHSPPKIPKRECTCHSIFIASFVNEECSALEIKYFLYITEKSVHIKASHFIF